MKQCNVCGEPKPLNRFWKAKRNKDGLRHYCMDCGAKESEKWRKNNPEKAKIFQNLSQLKSRYGLTPKDVELMKINQEGKCLICLEIKELVIDHCHKTGKVRGLLCIGCNSAIGKLKDSSDICIRAAEYIEKNK